MDASRSLLAYIGVAIPVYWWALLFWVYASLLPCLVLTPIVLARLDSRWPDTPAIAFRKVASCCVLLVPFFTLLPFAVAVERRRGYYDYPLHLVASFRTWLAPVVFAAVLYAVFQLHRSLPARIVLAVSWSGLAAIAVHGWVLDQSFRVEASFRYHDTQPLVWKVPAVEVVVLLIAVLSTRRRMRGDRARWPLAAAGFGAFGVGAFVLMSPSRFPARWQNADIVGIGKARLTSGGDLALIARRARTGPNESHFVYSPRPGEGWSPGDDAVVIRRSGRNDFECLSRRPIELPLATEADGSRVAVAEVTTPWRSFAGHLADGAIIRTDSRETTTYPAAAFPIFRGRHSIPIAIAVPDLWGPARAWIASRGSWGVRGELMDGKAFSIGVDPDRGSESFWIHGRRVIGYRNRCGAEQFSPCLESIDLSTGRLSRMPIAPAAASTVAAVAPDGSSVVLQQTPCPLPPEACLGRMSRFSPDGQPLPFEAWAAGEPAIVAWRRDNAPFLLRRDLFKRQAHGFDGRCGDYARELRQVGSRYFPVFDDRASHCANWGLLEVDPLEMTIRRVTGLLADSQLLSDSVLYVENQPAGQQVIRYWPDSGKREVLLEVRPSG